ncbi:MAG: TIGR02452 family protein [Clostridia bacterium]|nr:TIGR02452 family protein [Clostridia bacterium]
MTGQEKRTLIFEETMRVCNGEESLRSAMAASAAGQTIIWQEDAEPRWQPRFERPAKRAVSGKRSFEAARAYAREGKRVCVLNFASSVSPGGGVTYGSQAQEESLCRVSTLYPALSGGSAKPFYDRHWEMIRAGTMKRENRDDCICTPGVIVLREDAGEEPLLAQEERYTVDVITCAAPDLREVSDGSRYAPTQDELAALLTKRWRRILAVAAANGADVLILGAFGCGVFANPPQMVAQAFDTAAQGIDRCFETIEFAVYSREAASTNRRAFEAICGSRVSFG